MGLESGTYINSLNSANPLLNDPRSEGDDHIRLLKATLLATFAGITGAVSATHTELNYLHGVTGVTGTGKLVLDTSPTLITPILGTPTSGDLRNCSLAVAPAIGGTTPAAGTFTTLSYSSILSGAAGTVGAPAFYLGGDTTSGLYRIGANNLGVAISGAKVLDIASTGLAVTGTLSATSSVAGPYAGLTTTNANAGTTAYGGVTVSNGTATGTLLAAGTGYTTYGVITANSTGLYTNASAGLFLGCDHASGSVRIGIGTSVPQVASFTSAGLAVTGTLSATGTFTHTAASFSKTGAFAGAAATLTNINTDATAGSYAYTRTQCGTGGGAVGGDILAFGASSGFSGAYANNSIVLEANSIATQLNLVSSNASGVINFYAGGNGSGNKVGTWNSTSLAITGAVSVSGTNQFYVNGAGSGDYFQGVSAGISRIVAGGGEVIRFAGTGVSVTGLISATTTLGYATGAGGAVTQTTSRATGVTINKACGTITLVSAAGSTSWQSFTVTNSTVAATDTVRVSQWDGTTDIYEIHTLVSTGAFRIFFRTMSGTTTEQPVFNFTVVKSVAS